jgi:phenylacetic acid degradation operon negative regulatory protein
VASSPVTAKRVVLQLLSASGALEVSAALLVEMGELLGFTGNNVRVTLARLLAAGTVELTGRGMYRLGEQAQALGSQVRRWDELEKQVRRWDGAWACAHAGDLALSDRAARSRRDRALRLLGFRTLARGLEIRPDNLDGGVDGLRDRLSALGGGELLVFRGSELDAETEAKARSLWDAAQLTAG